MSLPSIRAALQAKLNAMATLATVWENQAYTPIDGTPYQAAYVMASEPDNPTLGDGFYRDTGVFHISLYYPIQTGTGAAETRAQLIRTTFKRGTSMTYGGIVVIVNRTPEISPGRRDGDRWHIPVKIRWYAEIYN